MNMKKNGFTLVELIMSLAILVSISLVMGIALNKVFKKNEDTEYNSMVSRITSAADIYLSNNSSLVNELYTNKGYILIKIGAIKKEGLLDADLTNPKTGEKVKDSEYVVVTLDAEGSFKFTYQDEEEVTGQSYLEVQTKLLDFNQGFSCMSLETYRAEWGSAALRLIEADGSVSSSSIDSVIQNVSCTVNTSIPGTYQITYQYLGAGNIKKTATRAVTVMPSMDDYLKLNITPNPVVVRKGGALAFSVTATNRRGEVIALIQNGSPINGYALGAYSSASLGNFTVNIAAIRTNSDGTIAKSTINYIVE